jgi:DNA-binding SARP family transcriptional activator
MPSFRLWTFGGLRLEGVGTAVPVSITQRKRLAFLTLLASSGERGIARERLLLLLWPESTAERARGALQQLLYVTRRAFGEGSIVGANELRLDPGVVSSDVGDFQAALASGDLAGAVRLYRGPFLDAFYLTGAPELERWVEDKRQEQARSYQTALSSLATQAIEARDFATAVRYAELLTVSDPLSGRATILLMEALAANGDVSVAVDRAREHAAVVQRELGLDADPGVGALVERLRLAGAAVASSPTSIPSGPAVPVGIAPASASTPVLPPAPAKARAARFRRPMIVVGALCAVVAAGFIVNRSSAPLQRELVIVADFRSTGADTAIADALAQAMRRALSDSRSLGAEPESRVQEVLTRLQVAPNAQLDVRLARQVAIAEGVRTVVDGSVVLFSGGYALSVRLISAGSGDVLASAERTVANPDGLIVALDSLSRMLRERAGDALKAVRATPPLEKLTSSSLEAMMKYTAARRALLVDGKFDEALELTRDAVALDTSFAAAIQQLEVILENARRGTDAERRTLLARAYAHRDRLTEEERLRIEGMYLYGVKGITPSRPERIEAARQIVAKYPSALDVLALANLYAQRQDWATAESLYRRAIAMDSAQFPAYVDLVCVLLTTGRVAEARRAVDEAERRLPAVPQMPQYEALVRYAEGRRGDVRAAWVVASRSADQQVAAVGYDGLARLDLLEGRVAAWHRDLLASTALDSAAGRLPETPFADLIANYWVFRRAGDGLRVLDNQKAPQSLHDEDLARAILYAQYDRPDRARALLAAHDSALRDTLGGWFQGTDRREVLGWILLAERRPRDAVVEFRASRMLSDGPANLSPVARDVEIGIAFERAGMPDSAIAAYEHYMNTPWAWHVIEDGFRVPWALEHVAALYDSKADAKHAIAAYQRLADLWREADPELQPRVAHARQRVAALSAR